MEKRPVSVRLTLVFMLINAVIWLGFGVIVLSGLHPALDESKLIRFGYGGIAILAAAFLMLMYFLLRKPKKIAWYLSVLFFVAGAVVTLFDDFGWVDLVFMLVDLVPLVLFIKDRKWYLNNG